METALILLPLLTLMFAGIDLGRYFLTTQSLVNLVNEATRRSLADSRWQVSCTTWSESTRIAPFLDPARLKVCVYPNSDAYQHNGVWVEATYEFETITPLPPVLNWLAGPLRVENNVSY
ncbi:MAG: TadE/TadG family type IV pilus assembly protein [Acetobacteraceae bacterium]